MALDLADHAAGSRPPLPLGLSLEALTDLAEAAEAAAASTPPGHPDHGSWSDSEARLHYWERLTGGQVCGAMLNATMVRDREGRVAGGLVVTRLPPAGWWTGGAWIAEVFVVPALQGKGLGRLLVTHAVELARLAGQQRIGLTVTKGNPAERLYRRLGFSRIRTLYVLEAPGVDSP